MNSKSINFINRKGIKISAILDSPEDLQVKAYGVFAHCFTCGKNLIMARNINKVLTKAGYAILRLDFTGLGESEGNFEDTNFTSNIEDLIDASKYLEDNHRAPKILLGHSLGGTAALKAGKEIKSIEAVISIAAPFDFGRINRALHESKEELQEKGFITMHIAGEDYKLKESFFEDVQKYDMRSIIKDLKKPLLVLHSPFDKVVGIKEAEKIFIAAMHPKSFVSLDEANHLLSKEEDAKYVGEVISGWAKKYVMDTEREEKKKHNKEYKVFAQIGEKPYKTKIWTDNHSYLSDEPTKYGGGDLGPNPYDYLLSALGACTAMTLRMYADRKKWDLKGVEVGLNHRRIHAQDCDKCEETGKKLEVITREIFIYGELSEEKRNRLMEIADRCPVHRTLESDLTIQTKEGKKEI